VVGGGFLTICPLNYLLGNRLYLGEINHRDQSYPGEHEPILDTTLFDAVQAKLDENRRGTRERHQASKALLLGKLFDDRGNPMTPSYAIKKGVRYRYYVSCVLAQGRKEAAGTVRRVAAEDVEQIVLEAVVKAGRANPSERDPIRPTIANENTRSIATAPSGSGTVREKIERVTLRAQSIDIELAETEFLTRERLAIPWTPQTFRRKREVIAPLLEAAAGQQPIRWLARTRLISAIARSRRWLDEIVSGRSAGIDAIAAREGLNERTARMTLSLAFLAPDIVKAALEGTLPRGLSASRLMELPDSWAEQRRVLGLATSA
jgi:hypothetical protein